MSDMHSKRRRLLLCAIFLLLLAVLAVNILKPSQGAILQRTAGVKPGDWVKYGDFLALWDSDNPAQRPFRSWIDVNETEWLTNTIVAVSGTNITFQSLTHFKNGSEVVGVNSIDVRTGVGLGSIMFISAGLSPGESLYYSEDFLSSKINDTTSRTYAGLTRSTNHLNVTYVDPDTLVAYVSNHYWDRATGVMVQRRVSTSKYDGDLFTWASLADHMVDNNIWIGAEDSTPPIAVAGANQTVQEQATASFDASSSTDNVGIASFRWSFGDGAEGTGMQTTHAYTKAGTYTVTLTVSDAKGNSGTDTLEVTVTEATSLFPPIQPGIAAILVIAAISVLLWFILRRRS